MALVNPTRNTIRELFEKEFPKLKTKSILYTYYNTRTIYDYNYKFILTVKQRNKKRTYIFQKDMACQCGDWYCCHGTSTFYRFIHDLQTDIIEAHPF